MDMTNGGPVVALESYINIRLQDGPIKENGVNGCQIDTVIEWCRNTIEWFNTKDDGAYACQENVEAITKLDEVLLVLQRRTANREARGVEGTSKL